MNVLRGENRFGFRGQLTLDFPLVAKLESGDVKPEDPQVKEILFQLKERVRINADFNTELRQLAEEHEKITTEH